MTIQVHIEMLAWDSAFFARRVAMLRPAVDAAPLRREALTGFALIQAKIDAADYLALDGLSQLGFQVAEAEVELSAQIPARDDEPAGVRRAEPTDIPALRLLATQAFVTTRFRPPWFAPGEGGRLYAQWVENAVHGTFDHACFLAYEQADCVGFITLRRLPGQAARIGLVAVKSGRARRGIGRRLVQAAYTWSRDAGANTLRVATQLGNLRALGLFQASGFSLVGTSYWLYSCGR